jgi:two-component system sensor histidine kinase UhpB
MTLEKSISNVLIVEDNEGDYELLREYINDSTLVVENIFHAKRIKDVPILVDGKTIDIALLDLSLSDSTGVDSVITLKQILNKTPIVVLSGAKGIEIAMQAISLGAQDFLVKGEFDERLLSKSLQYSIERKRIIENLYESNERYEFINKATMDTIWEYNCKTGIGKWGEGIVNVFGYSKNDIYFDHTVWEKFVHPDDFEKTSKNLYHKFENKIENWEDEYRLRAATGEYREVYARGYILFDIEGKPFRMFGAVTDITERKRLEKELLREKLDRQKLITDITIEAQEKERNELGRELHDNINQMLATVKIYLGMIISHKDPNEQLLPTIFKYVNDTIEEIRKLSKTLVTPSLGDTDLKEALEELVEEVNLDNAVKVKLLIKIDKKLGMEDKKKLMLYRIVQEQLTNIRKHAQAKKAIVTIKCVGNTLCLSISDNGKGFDTTKKAYGIGLKNITSRVEFYSGKVNIVSAPNKGCLLEIFIPI